MSFEEIAVELHERAPSRVERVVYSFENELDHCCDLLLWFGPALVRLHQGIDEAIAWASTPWVDVFAGSEAENEEYLRTHGRFKLIDVSDAPGYRDLVGASIERVLPLTNKFGTTSGVRLELERGAANVYVGGDELFVTFGDDVPLW